MMSLVRFFTDTGFGQMVVLGAGVWALIVLGRLFLSIREVEKEEKQRQRTEENRPHETGVAEVETPFMRHEREEWEELGRILNIEVE